MAAKKKTASKKASKKVSAKKATEAETQVEESTETENVPAVAEDNALVTGGIDFAADADAGMEGTDKDSFAIPFLRPLQQLSPQVTPGKAEFIEEAKAGQLFNTVTGELYDGEEGLTFLPCAFQRRFLQWGPRGSERGFAGEHLPEDVERMRSDGSIVEVDGKLLVADAETGEASEKRSDSMADTRSHFGLVVDEDGNASPVLLALSSSQVKKSKQLMMMLSQAKCPDANGKKVTPPTWMNRITIQTVLETNDQGSWYGVKFTADGFISDPELYAQGKTFYEQINAGEVETNYAAAKEEAGTEDGDKF